MTAPQKEGNAHFNAKLQQGRRPVFYKAVQQIALRLTASTSADWLLVLLLVFLLLSFLFLRTFGT
jgi:hypothetical protein